MHPLQVKAPDGEMLTLPATATDWGREVPAALLPPTAKAVQISRGLIQESYSSWLGHNRGDTGCSTHHTSGRGVFPVFVRTSLPASFKVVHELEDPPVPHQSRQTLIAGHTEG